MGNKQFKTALGVFEWIQENTDEKDSWDSFLQDLLGIILNSPSLNLDIPPLPDLNDENVTFGEVLDHPYVSAYTKAIDHIFKNIESKLETAMMELLNESVGVAAKAQRIPLLITADVLERIRETDTKRMKAALAIGPGGSKAKHDLRNLLEYYQCALPLVQRAKAFYKSIQSRKNWHELVKQEYPDLDDDLILRLPKFPSLPDEIAESVDRQGSTSKPSDLALEWAARQCGVPPYEYTIAHLKSVKGSKNGRTEKKD